MIEFFHKDRNEWIEFYPLKLDFCIEKLDYRKFSELPQKIDGKYIFGMCGYNPAWAYTTIDKKNLRFIDKNNKEDNNNESPETSISTDKIN